MEKKQLSEKLIGDRIYLQKHSAQQAQAMFDYIQEDRERLLRFLPWVEFINTIDDEVQYIESCHEKWSECTGFGYGIFQKKNHLYMGNIGVHTIRWNHNNAELGYWILGKFEGQGFMSESVRVLEKHLFHMGFHRVQIRCDEANQRSARIPERCGYVYEGTAREDVIDNGVYKSSRTYSKLSSEASL